jgi:HEAT repeat protein
MEHPVFFCRHCWHELPEDSAHCPVCGQAAKERLSYREELELALRCPEALTARRAAYLLGELAEPDSVPALMLAVDEGDPYVAAEAVTALARIATPQAVSALVGALAHCYVTVRVAAEQTLAAHAARSERLPSGCADD